MGTTLSSPAALFFAARVVVFVFVTLHNALTAARRAGITRDGLNKRRATGGKRVQMRKKRQFLLGRPAAMTRIGAKRVHPVRARGGNIKNRAVRLEHGSFSWGSEAISKKARIIEVLYNASSNELVRTNTLVKGCVVAVEGAPFTDWYKGYYGVTLGKATAAAPAAAEPKKAKEAKEGKKPKQGTRATCSA